jgi:hypothetical protein
MPPPVSLRVVSLAWGLAAVVCIEVACSSHRANVEAPALDDPASCVDEAPASGDSGSAGSGYLASETIRSVIQSHYPGFMGCYELGRQPRVQSRVTLQLSIGLEGKITRLRVVENELADCAAVQCMRDEMARIEFPPPEGGTVTVEYPLVFAPAQ